MIFSMAIWVLRQSRIHMRDKLRLRLLELPVLGIFRKEEHLDLFNGLEHQFYGTQPIHRLTVPS